MADSFSSAGTFHPGTAEIKDGQSERCCVRKAWKAPEKFFSGSNTLSYVTQLAGQNPVWFKASHDAYQFFLGASTKAFYTISLLPEDLGSHDTSLVGWTVIAKTWATPQALTAAGWPYTEDLVGKVWIHKELNWVSRVIYDVSFAVETWWKLQQLIWYIGSDHQPLPHVLQPLRQRNLRRSMTDLDQEICRLIR